jgi:pyrimidine-nucleoside phosphorylase
MQTVALICKKRDGHPISTAEINWLIEQYTQGNIPDYQMASLLMAIYLRGMDEHEISDLTLAIAHSGAQLHVTAHMPIVIDKHSTGGVGDKVTLAVAPLVAACGVAVGKMTGRGLGHTGGTVDKLEAIDGFQAELSRADFMRILHEHKIVLAGQSSDLAPADGKLYALRDVTGTIESIPLIASSIMSKKLAIGASHLLLDVKFGSGAFMKTIEQARELAQTMVAIGRVAGLHTVAAITSMEQPLGRAIGNALELKEAIAILHGTGPADVTELCYHEARELLIMTKRAADPAEAKQIIMQAIQSGEAAKKLAEVIAAQGGNPQQIEHPDLLPDAPVRLMQVAARTGYIAAINAEGIGKVSMSLGAGRFKKGDPIDHRTGLLLQAKVGDFVKAGAPLIEIHARNIQEAHAIQPTLHACYQWSDTSISMEPLICDIIYP